MGFDPNAFLRSGAPAAPAAGFDPDAFLRGPSAPAPAAAPENEDEEPSLLNATLRGAKQGLTFGFGDEISGALESAFTEKTYKQARDEARAADAAARKAHPYGFGLGEIIGGAGSGIATGGLGVGAGLARSIVTGVGTGLVTGIGESEKSDVPRIVQDAARGGLVGGALGAAGHGLSRILGGSKGIVMGAEERADHALTGDLLEKVPARTQDKALAKLGGGDRDTGRSVLARMIRDDPKLATAKTDGTLLAEVGAQKEEVGKAIGDVIKAVDLAAPGAKGVALTDVLKPINMMRAEAQRTGDLVRYRALGREADGLVELWKGRNLDKGISHVPAEDVHGLIQRYGRGGFEGGSFDNPGDARQLGRDLWAEVKDVLHGHVEDVAQRSGLQGNVEQLQALNRQYSKLSALEELADAQATRAARNSPSLGERFGALANVAHAGHVISSPLTGIPTLLAAKAAPVIGRRATVALAHLNAAARAGAPLAQLAQSALAEGVPRGTVEAIVSGATPAQDEEATP